MNREQHPKNVSFSIGEKIKSAARKSLKKNSNWTEFSTCDIFPDTLNGLINMKFFVILLFANSVIISTALSDVLSDYPTMRKIAGLSAREDQNFWISSYEGANPRAVELSNPHDCGTDVYGRIYLVDKESHSVLRVSADGSEITTVAGTHFMGNGGDSEMTATAVALNNPNGLHVLADGTFYILDTGNQKIRRVSSIGVCTTVLSYPNGFGTGRGLWVSEDEQTIYFCGEFTLGTNQNVMRFIPGNPPTVFANIEGGNNGLGNLDVAPDQSVGITSAGGHRVYRVRGPGVAPIVIAGNGSTSGEPADGSSALSAPLNRVRGIAFLPDGSYFLATQKGGDIWWVDLSGDIHRFVSGAGSGNATIQDGVSRTIGGDKLAEPRAIHLATNGDLIIISNDNGVVQAVNTTKRPKAPQLEIGQDEDGLLNLKFRGSFQGQYLFESSELLHPGSWEVEAVFTTIAPTTQSFPVLPNQTQRFWRLRTPTQAGGGGD